MGCGHEFHFNCLATWFYKQCENGNSETCPLCRREATATEALPTNDDEESENESDDDEDYEEEFGEDEALFTRAGIDAFLRTHGGIGATEELFTHWTGGGGETMGIDYDDLNGVLMTQGAQPISQDTFNGLLGRVHGAPAAPATRWVRTGEGRWERVALAAPAAAEAAAGAGGGGGAGAGGYALSADAEPFVWDGTVTVAPPPDSLALQTNEAAKKIQAAYRGYKTYQYVVGAMGLLRLSE
jgi:hypothetical protein